MAPLLTPCLGIEAEGLSVTTLDAVRGITERGRSPADRKDAGEATPVGKRPPLLG